MPEQKVHDQERLKLECPPERPNYEVEATWWAMMKEAKECRKTWGMGFPVISTFLLRKYWHKVTGWMPPE